MDCIERFINYAKIDTQSDDRTGKTPSTEKQKNLSLLLVKELKELGLEDAYMDEYAVVYAHLKGEGTHIGFNSHVDTALEVTGKDVKPRIIKNYDGGDIKLNDEYTLTQKQFPIMKQHIGHDLVVTDGNTLLGADDKAGIAIIMSALEYLVNHPEIKHKNICVAFTPDEEIGEGPLHFDINKMQAEYAYTIDGSYIDAIDFENFNAMQLHLHIDGVSVHPGEGKNALINAAVLMSEFISALPQDETPYDANEDEGFWHINDVQCSSEKGDLFMILRDFDENTFLIENIQNKWPKATLKAEFKDQYENMRKYVEKDNRPVLLADKILVKNGLTPKHSKIRGGTDGATFSKMGLVTPNLGTGSYNHHGRFEFLDIQEFKKMIDIVIDLMTIE